MGNSKRGRSSFVASEEVKLTILEENRREKFLGDQSRLSASSLIQMFHSLSEMNCSGFVRRVCAGDGCPPGPSRSECDVIWEERSLKVSNKSRPPPKKKTTKKKCQTTVKMEMKKCSSVLFTWRWKWSR